jgi:hypothetical protein
MTKISVLNLFFKRTKQTTHAHNNNNKKSSVEDMLRARS